MSLTEGLAEEQAVAQPTGSTDAPGSGSAGPRGHRAPGTLRWTFRIVIALLILQFLVLLGLSAYAYHRFTVGLDFAIFSQAWSQIGSGHLNPYSTLHGVPYVKSHFELIMWPLGLLHLVTHSPFVLLVVQAAAVFGTEVVLFIWMWSFVRKAGLSTRWVIALSAGTAALLLAAPAAYATVVEDFHFEALATFFVVFAGFDLWSGRTRRMWVWVVLCLLCGDFGGLYVLALGLSGLVVRDRRRAGLALFVVGLAWVGVISVLGANQGSNVSTAYAYLAGRRSLPGGASGLALIVKGALTHPARAAHTISPRFGSAVRYILNGGAVGVASPWGFFIPLVVLGTSALQSSSIFIGLPFQNFVVIPFVIFGSVWLVRWLVQRADTSARTALAVGVAVFALVVGLGSSAQRLHSALNTNASHGFVSGATATALGQALDRIPAGAEVVVPIPTAGRFAQRPYVYLLVERPHGGTETVPVKSKSVVVVVDPDVTGAPGPSTSEALVRQLEASGGRVLVSSNGVTAVLWHPSAGERSLGSS